MSDELKKKFFEEMEEVGQLMEQAAREYDADCEKFWMELSYEDKLKAFHSVCKRIHKGDVEDKRSYRGVLYDVFDFDVDSYLVGMDCGYISIHNYIQDGIASHRRENEHLPEDL